MSTESHPFDNGITVSEFKKIIAEWSETDKHGEPHEVWITTGANLSSPCRRVSSLNRCDHGNGEVSSDILLSPGVDHKWEHEEEITKLRADLETAENTALRLAEKADAMRAVIEEAFTTIKDATDNCLWRSDSPIPLSEEESQRIYNLAVQTMDNLRPFLP